MTFKASLDKTAIVITTIVTILFVVIIGVQFSISNEVGRVAPLFTAIVLLMAYLLAFAFRPVNYIVTNDELIVRRLISNVRIKKADIQTAELIDRSRIRGSIRTFGVGGLFGYFGKFANFSIGSMVWYATRRDNPVLITSVNNKKIILTPDDPSHFIAELGVQ
jgi:hypothetical protein